MYCTVTECGAYVVRLSGKHVADARSKPTWPVSCGGSGTICAGVTDGVEDRLPAPSGVAPVVRLQDERSLRAIGDHEAVNHMVQLAAIATPLINVTHQLPGLAAVCRILGAEGEANEGREEMIGMLK